jgi:alkanesulfonate monooxygenase SsuD/methylene tetrahydromethanopterin reductase-like flavin-dependent oxidoreductase (luciferase family)
VTWRLAARFADELNLDALTPDQVKAALPVIASRCAEVGRDPATLRVAVHVWGAAGDVAPGRERQRRLARYAELGLSRVILQGFAAVGDPGMLDALAGDCAAVGLLER